MPIFAPLDKPPPPAPEVEVEALGASDVVELVWPAAAVREAVLVLVSELEVSPELELELVVVVDDVDTRST